jgi:hypothetical protein
VFGVFLQLAQFVRHVLGDPFEFEIDMFVGLISS